MRTPAGVSVDLLLNRSDQRPLHQQIYSQIRDLIIGGALASGSVLPSVRCASEAWGVSRPTIERAYLQLVTEGYIDNKPRSGYCVRTLDTQFLQQVTNQSALLSRKEIIQPQRRIDFFRQFQDDPAVRYDFAFARLAKGSFPSKTWLRIAGDVLFYESDSLLTGYSGDHEANSLQVQLCSFLQRTRGVVSSALQVQVFPSTENALCALLQLFDPAKCLIGVEEPGFLTVVNVAARLGFKTCALSSDQSADRFLHDVYARKPTLLFTTPSHQFPTGKVMQLDTRVELLKWAQANNAFIIEDDSCSEYRYNTDPIPSLQSLDDTGCVIYLSNFSKVLAPGLRVAYAVLPPLLMQTYYDRFTMSGTAVSALIQQILARFIEEGHLDKHIRKTVTRNRICHDLLVKHLTEQMDNKVTLQGLDAGMHLYATVHNGMDQTSLLKTAAAYRAKVYRSDLYWFEHPAPQNSLLIGFSAIDPQLIPAGVRALQQAWFS